MKWKELKVIDVCELAYGKSLTSESRIPGAYQYMVLQVK